jgi:tetrahydromethanopterin S-methyltransferase subunit G
MIKTEKTFSVTELDAIHKAIARLRADVMSLVFGIIGGVLLFLMTIWLVIRGPTDGQTVGPHLELLNQYFPGYEVTVLGSFVGLFYGAITGAVIGWIIAFIYNSVAEKRLSKVKGFS